MTPPDGVAVAAGGAERRARHPHARSRDHAGVHRLLQRDDDLGVGAHVADAGEAGHQLGAGVVHRVDLVVVSRPRHRVADRVALVEAHGDVVVAVDQPRQHRGVRQVDDLGAGRRGEARLDRDDAVVAHQDRHLLPRLGRDAVDEPPGMDHHVLGRRALGRKQSQRARARARREGRPQALADSRIDHDADVRMPPTDPSGRV
jgi:hypothetical protein